MDAKSTYQKPQGIVDCGDSSSMSGMSNLSNEKRAASVCQGSADTNEEAASQIHWSWVGSWRKGLEKCTKKDDQTS